MCLGVVGCGAENFAVVGVGFDEKRAVHLQKAKAVVVCANGAETPRLLLLSANKQFPNGLANSSGIVGKYLMFNSGGVVTGQFEHPLNDYKGYAVSRVLHDFYELDPQKVVVKLEVNNPDLSRVDEIGYVDLMPGGGHGTAGCSNVSWIELYATPRKR